MGPQVHGAEPSLTLRTSLCNPLQPPTALYSPLRSTTLCCNHDFVI